VVLCVGLDVFWFGGFGLCIHMCCRLGWWLKTLSVCIFEFCSYIGFKRCGVGVFE